MCNFSLKEKGELDCSLANFFTLQQHTKIRNVSTRKWLIMTTRSSLERILSVVTVLGFICLCIGLLLHIVGRVSNYIIVARVGAYMLVLGILLVASRVSFWIAEKMVKQSFKRANLWWNKIPDNLTNAKCCSFFSFSSTALARALRLFSHEP